MKILMMGPPGAGKGSQSAKVVEHYDLPSISTGQMFRDAYKNNEPMGIEAMKYIKDGNLVSDDITNEIVRLRLSKNDAENSFLLDGYPRTVAQAIALDNLLEEMSRLNQSFGIGIIELNANPFQSKILFPASLMTKLSSTVK